MAKSHWLTLIGSVVSKSLLHNKLDIQKCIQFSQTGLILKICVLYDKHILQHCIQDISSYKPREPCGPTTAGKIFTT